MKTHEAQKVNPMQVDRFKAKNMSCYNCNSPGHYARSCPEPKKTKNRSVTIKMNNEQKGELGFPQENT